MHLSPKPSIAHAVNGSSDAESNWVDLDQIELGLSAALSRWRSRVPGQVPGVAIVGLASGSGKARRAVDSVLEGAITDDDQWSRLADGTWVLVFGNSHSWDALDDRILTLHYAMEQALLDTRANDRVVIGASLACAMFSQSGLLVESARKAMELASRGGLGTALADRLAHENGYQSRLANHNWPSRRPMFETVHHLDQSGILALTCTPDEIEQISDIYKFSSAWLEGAGPGSDVHLFLSDRIVLGTDPQILSDTLGRGASELRGRLVLEVTGRVAFHPRAEERVVELSKRLGMGLAFANFGHNRLDLSLLRSLPFDIAKVEVGLLESIAVEPEQLAGDLRRYVPTIVATGVSNTEQRDLVTRLGFDAAQGPAFSRSGRKIRYH